MKFRFNNPQFVKTAVLPKDYPVIRDKSGDPLIEIAFVGRSNVGKSSLINHLFQHHGIARTSSTPGKTQHINFFQVPDSLAIVDLPRYGYAKVPDAVRKSWGPMVQSYLEGRNTLKLVLFLFDIRREPNEEDVELMQWFLQQGKPVILVLTKVDKVSRGEMESNTIKIIKRFDAGALPYVHYSATKNMGRTQLIKKINEELT